MRSKSVLGLSFEEESFESVIQRVSKVWSVGARLRIATVNPEFLVAAENGPSLKQNLQKAEVRVVDGVGLWFLLKLQGWQGERITGIDLVEKLLTQAAKERRSVIVILKKEGLSSQEQVQSILKKKYPALLVTVRYTGEAQDLQGDLVLIATGAPEQEFLAEQFQKGVVIGVGGAIDFLTGAQKRAPKFLQVIGLEWFWRLLLQPKRIKRIWNAVVIFPLLVLKNKKS